MKTFRTISTGALLFLFAVVAPMYAQEQHDRDQGKPEQGHENQKPAERSQPAPQQPRATHTQPVPAKQAPSRTLQSYGGQYHGGVKATEPATHGGVHPSGVPQHAGQVRSGFTQSRASSWSNDHKTWAQRGGYNGYRIPDARFEQYFGHDHVFHISALPLLFVGGMPRFQYDGYWITFVDSWPDNWPPNWYETDNCYLDYTNDGYYLYDTNYPGIGIAVTVSF